MEFKTIYVHDEAGYYSGRHTFQVLEGVFMPDNATETPLPEDADLETNFYKWDGESLQAEKKPTSAVELLGIVVSHTSQTKHDQEMREIVQRLGKEDGYRVRRGDDMSWYVEKIPMAEIEAQAINVELSDFDRQIAWLRPCLWMTPKPWPL